MELKVGDKVRVKKHPGRIGPVTDILRGPYPYKVQFGNLPSDFSLYRGEELETVEEVLRQHTPDSTFKQTLLDSLHKVCECKRSIIAMYAKEGKYQLALEYEIRLNEDIQIMELIKHTED